MMLAVMTRASGAHWSKIKADNITNVSYVILASVAFVRPLAEMFPGFSTAIVLISAAGWTLAFGLFTLEHIPMLCVGRKSLTVREARPST